MTVGIWIITIAINHAESRKTKNATTSNESLTVRVK